ncbi:MAG: MarR family transcriptional regulator [Oscillospiraceae bacterium]
MDDFFKLINFLSKKSVIYLDNKLCKYNLNYSYAIYLMHICWTPGIKQDELTKHLQYHRSTTIRTTKHLEDNGYITKQECCDDKRTFILFPTDKGNELLKTIESLRQEWTELVLKDLSEEEKSSICKYLFDFNEKARGIICKL